MTRKYLATVSMLLLTGVLSAAEVQLADVLSGVQNGVVQLNPADTYVGNVYLGTDRTAVTIEGNGATIRIDSGNFINANGMFLTVRNARLTGASGAFFLASPNGERSTILTLEDVVLEGSGRDNGQNGVYSENSKVVINRVQARNLTYGLSLNGVTLEVGELCVFEDNKNGILASNGTTITTPSVAPNRPLTFRRNNDNGLLLQNSSALLNACEFYQNGSTGQTLIALNSTLTLAQNCLLQDNTVGLVASGGSCDVFQTNFVRNGFRDIRLQDINGMVHDCTFTGTEEGIGIINNSDIDIFDCTFTDNRRRGVDAFRENPGDPEPRIKVRNCQITVSLDRSDTDWDAGINLIDVADALLESNTISGWRTCIQISSSKAEIRNNTLRLARQPDGFGDRGQGIAAINNSELLATDNFIEQTEGDNIFVSSGSTATIRGNLLVSSRENGVLAEEREGTNRVVVNVYDNDIRNPTVGIAMVGNVEGHLAGNTIYVPFEDRVFADPSRGILLEETTGQVRVENNLVFDTPLTSIFIDRTSNHSILGNVFLQSGLFGYESSQSSGNTTTGNLISGAWETGARVVNGQNHTFRRNAIVSNFRRQLSDNGTGLFYNMSFASGTTGTVEFNSLESTLNRKGGLESSGATAVSAVNNWWGSPDGPAFSTAQETGPAAVVTGPNVTTTPFQTSPTVRHRSWYREPVTANVPKSFHDFANTGVGINLETGQNVGEAVVAIMVSGTAPADSGTVAGAEFIQVSLSHQLRSQLKGRRFDLLVPKSRFSGVASYFEATDRTWRRLSAIPREQDGNLMISVDTSVIMNTTFALELGTPEPAINLVLGLARDKVTVDQNADGVIDAADVYLE